jgi:protein SCO1
MRMRRAFLAAAALAAAQLAGCDRIFTPPRTPFHGLDVTGADMGGEVRLKDPTGKERTLADFRGKVVALFFGYTQCPDVCPTTLADMANAMQLLGPDAQNVQVLFVTVDPKRDTPELLAQYVPAFNPSFPERAGATAGTYTMDHSAQTLVFDRNGRLRLLFPYGLEPAKIAGDLKVLMNS